MLRQGEVRRDGRAIAWAAWGDPEGRPVFRIHGTPGSRMARNPDPDVFSRAGALVISFDRPGYGRSGRHRDRTIISVADDALVLADELGWNRFSVLGISGGGPHALALGLRGPERIRALGLAVGGTPEHFIDDDDLIEFNREARRRAKESRASLEEFLAEPAATMMADPIGTLASAMKDAPPVDREMLERREVQAVLMDSLREAFRQGPEGWFDDSWVLSNDWGFDLGDVRLPVHMWYGELDRNVPLNAMKRMGQELQVASLTVIPGAGHLGWLAQEEEVLLTLLD
jgi:pimeloyl-ACP methyl ester carboxylesterase